MSDFDPNNVTQFSKNQDQGSSKDVKEQMSDAAAEVKQRAGDAFRSSADVARDKFGEAADAAKGVADETLDQIHSKAREQQRSGADFVERLAENIREAGRAFESDVPFAARGIGSAADYVEEAAQKIRDGSFRDLVDGATDFAKRQPAAFLGISVLAGFVAVRFLKASGGQSSSQGHRSTTGSTSGSEKASSATSFSTGERSWSHEARNGRPQTQQESHSQGSITP